MIIVFKRQEEAFDQRTLVSFSRYDHRTVLAPLHYHFERVQAQTPLSLFGTVAAFTTIVENGLHHGGEDALFPPGPSRMRARSLRAEKGSDRTRRIMSEIVRPVG